MSGGVAVVFAMASLSPPSRPNTAPKRSPHMRDKGAREGLRYLRDLAVFMEELQGFLTMLPPDTPPQALVRVPAEITADPRFENLVTMSLAPYAYRSNIPKDSCHKALVAVHDLARETFVAMSMHPVFRNFGAVQANPPFFEQTLLVAATIGVEHDLVSSDDAIRKRRKGAKCISKACPPRKRGKGGSGEPQQEIFSDEEISSIAEAFDYAE